MRKSTTRASKNRQQTKAGRKSATPGKYSEGWWNDPKKWKAFMAKTDRLVKEAQADYLASLSVPPEDPIRQVYIAASRMDR
jgi:hypothetical protein